MKQAPRVRAFKNELRNYNYYNDEVSKMESMIEEIYYRLSGLRGIDPSKEPTHSMPNKEAEWNMRNKIEILEAQKRFLEMKRDYINSILNEIETPLRDAIMYVYCDGKTLENVSLKYNLSPSGLNKRIIVALKKALN